MANGTSLVPGTDFITVSTKDIDGAVEFYARCSACLNRSA